MVFLTAHRQRDSMSRGPMSLSRSGEKKFSVERRQVGHWQQPEASRLDFMPKNVLIGPHMFQDKFRAFTFHPVEIDHHEPAVLALSARRIDGRFSRRRFQVVIDIAKKDQVDRGLRQIDRVLVAHARSRPVSGPVWRLRGDVFQETGRDVDSVDLPVLPDLLGE